MDLVQDGKAVEKHVAIRHYPVDNQWIQYKLGKQ